MTSSEIHLLAGYAAFWLLLIGFAYRQFRTANELLRQSRNRAAAVEDSNERL